MNQGVGGLVPGQEPSIVPDIFLLCWPQIATPGNQRQPGLSPSCSSSTPLTLTKAHEAQHVGRGILRIDPGRGCPAESPHKGRFPGIA